MKKTMEISEDLDKNNLADILYQRDDEDLSGEREAFLFRMLLVDKLGYKYVSGNLESAVEFPGDLAKEFSEWNGVDLVAAYHHPDMGVLIANPKIAAELACFGAMRQRELLVIYAGKGSEGSCENCLKAAKLALNLFEGKKVNVPQELLRGSFAGKTVKKPGIIAEKPALKTAKGTGKKKPADQISDVSAPKNAGSAETANHRMTTMYSVVVSNELFHNGNVEAWKRIIVSYTAKYPGLQVFVYYNGERIMDINSLFKWRKIKHGSSILFAVAGSGIKDVAKLKRYLTQGASSLFEAFLHRPSNGILKLFG